MSDVPLPLLEKETIKHDLIKKMEDNKTYYTYIECKKLSDVLDALRKFQDYLEKEKKLLKDANLQYNSNMDYTPEMYILMGIFGKFNEVFGVLDSQNNLNEVKKL